MTAAVHLGRSLWNLPPVFGRPEEPAGQLGPGHPAPSVMMAGQSLGNLPFLIEQNNIYLVEIHRNSIT